MTIQTIKLVTTNVKDLEIGLREVTSSCKYYTNSWYEIVLKRRSFPAKVLQDLDLSSAMSKFDLLREYFKEVL